MNTKRNIFLMSKTTDKFNANESTSLTGSIVDEILPAIVRPVRAERSVEWPDCSSRITSVQVWDPDEDVCRNLLG